MNHTEQCTLKFIRGVYEAQDLRDDVRFPAAPVCSASHPDEQVGGRKAIPAHRVTERVPGTIPQLQSFGRISISLMGKNRDRRGEKFHSCIKVMMHIQDT